MRFGGQLFCSRTILIWLLFSGIRTPVLKRSDWALFGISGLNIALMGSWHFAGFFKNARIGKPGIL
jgi:hypothetical protein